MIGLTIFVSTGPPLAAKKGPSSIVLIGVALAQFNRPNVGGHYISDVLPSKGQRITNVVIYMYWLKGHPNTSTFPIKVHLWAIYGKHARPGSYL